MTSPALALVLAFLLEGIERETDVLSPYLDTSSIVSEGNSSTLADPRAPVGGIDLIFMLSIVNTDDLDNLFDLIDLEAENVFSGSGALWYHFGPSSALEFKLAYIEKTEYKSLGGVTLADVDSMEATVAYVYCIGGPGMIKAYLLIGGGVHRWKGDGIIDDEDDSMAIAGGGVIIKLGSLLGLVFDARYARIFVDDADPQDNWHVGAGLSISLGP